VSIRNTKTGRIPVGPVGWVSVYQQSMMRKICETGARFQAGVEEWRSDKWRKCWWQL